MAVADAAFVHGAGADYRENAVFLLHLGRIAEGGEDGLSENQKHLVAIFLCIAGLIGTLMALKDNAAQKSAGTGQTVETEAVEWSQPGG